MKSKKIIIGSVVCIICAIVLGAWSMALVGWDIFALDTEVYEQKEQLSTTEINKISLNVSNANIEFKRSENSHYTIRYVSSSRYPTSSSEGNGVLTVTASQNWESWFGNYFRGIKQIKHSIVIEVPNGASPKLDISVTNCSFTLTDFTLPEINIDSVNTDISLIRVVSPKISVNGTNMTLDMTECTLENGLSYSGVTAEITINNSLVRSINVSSVNTVMKLDKLVVDSMVFPSNTNVNIRGSIKGVASEYRVEINAVNNSGNLRPGGDASLTKLIKVNTVNLDANITFVQ